MARPRCYRRISEQPIGYLFKPAGVPSAGLEHVPMSADELEAIRLADHQRLYQAEAAEQMSISRQTFGRILATARQKIARVLIDGLALQIEAAGPETVRVRRFRCETCEHEWELAFGIGQPKGCPACETENIRRVV